MSAILRLLLAGPDDLAELVRVVKGAGLPGDNARQPGRRFFRAIQAGAGACYGGLGGDGADLLLRSVAVLLCAGSRSGPARRRLAAPADHEERPLLREPDLPAERAAVPPRHRRHGAVRVTVSDQRRVPDQVRRVARGDAA